MTSRFSRRRALGAGAGALAVAAVGGLSACSGRGAPPPPPGASVGGTDLLEAPMLTERIEAGKLPPLEKRLPVKPMEQELLKGPGSYGGTIRTSQTAALQAQIVTMYASYGLLEWDLHGNEGIPSLAESVEANGDNTTFTITLREGAKWSDGTELTVDDILFALNDVLLNKTLNPSPPIWFRNTDGSDPKVVERGGKVEVSFANSFSLFAKYLYMPFQSYQAIKPKHYLKDFHPDYTKKAKILAAAKKAGFSTWDQMFVNKDDLWLNPDRPTAAAYVLTKSASGATGTAEYERNPYYFKTDPDGRQLPYVDKLQAQVLEPETLTLRAASGDLSLQGLSLSFPDTGMLQDSAESNGYRVLRWKGASTQQNIFPNHSHKDPVLRKIFQNIDFRAALSHAINRDEMNSQLLGGVGSYRQFCPEKGDDYFVEGTGQRFLDFDVAKANQLLDDMGLTDTDRNGTRLRPDGKPLDLVVIFVEANSQNADMLEFVANAWREIGVKLTPKAVDDTLYYQVLPANDYDLIQYSGHMRDWDMEPIWFAPTSSSFRAAPAYGEWCSTGGKSGIKPTAEFKQLWDWWNELVEAPTDEERVAAGQKISKQWDEQVYVLGMLDIPFRPIVVDTELQNVRDDEDTTLVYFHGFDGATRPEQLYFTS